MSDVLESGATGAAGEPEPTSSRPGAAADAGPAQGNDSAPIASAAESDVAPGAAAADEDAASGGDGADTPTAGGAAKRRRRGTRGGRSRSRTRVDGVGETADTNPAEDAETTATSAHDLEPDLPDRPIEGKVQSIEVAERVLVRRPKIGDSRPAPVIPPPSKDADGGADVKESKEAKDGR